MGSLRLGGLLSGLDTESLISQLMTIERRPMVLATQRQRELETERGVWKDIQMRLSNLKAKAQELKAGAAGFSSGKAVTSDDKVVRATGGEGAVPGVYSLTVSNLANAHSVASDVLASTGALGIAGSFSISTQVSDTETWTVQVALDGTETIDQIRSKIADAQTADKKKLALTATVIRVDATTSRLVLTANSTGAKSQMTFTEVSGSPLTGSGQKLGIPLSMPATPAGNTLQVARDATIQINGITLIRSSNTFSDAIPGVKLELLQDSGSATVTVTRDLDKAVSTIKAFVDQYNSLADFITEKSMYDPQTKLGGPLVGEGNAIRLLNQLRQDTLSQEHLLPAGWDQASQVGLAGTPFDKDKAGALRKLALNESKLRTKLEENPKAVEDLFDKIQARLTETIVAHTKSTGILPGKDREFDAQVKRVKDQVAAMERRLELREKNLRRQFESLEVTLQRLQSQQATLTAQLGQISGNG